MSPKNGAKPLVPYIRQSRKREHSISVDEQRRSIRAWAKANGEKLAAEVVEEGVSGSKPWQERELGQAIANCGKAINYLVEKKDGTVKARRIDPKGPVAQGIIVAFQDRLSRENGLGTAEVWEALEAAGARLVCASEGLDTAKGDQELQFGIKAVIAREQWKRFKRNWDDATRNAVERGVHMSSYVPAGYDRPVGKDGKAGPLVPNEHAPAVRRAFELRADGASWAEICRALMEAGVPNQKGGEWLYRSARAVVTNPVYTGEARYGAHRNPVAHPAIVDPALWRACQTTLGPPVVTRGPEGALCAGLLRCSSCGRKLVPSITDGRYRCRPAVGARAGAPGCEAPASVSMRETDEFVVGRLYADEAKKEAPPAVDLEPLRTAVATARQRYEALVSGGEWEFDPAAFRAKGAELKAAVEAAEDALRSVEVEAASATGHLGSWEDMTMAERRRWLWDWDVCVLVDRGKGPVAERAHFVHGAAELDAQIKAEWAAARAHG